MSWFSFILGLNSFFLLFLDMVIKTEPQHIHVYPGLQVSKCDISSPLKRGGDFVTKKFLGCRGHPLYYIHCNLVLRAFFPGLEAGRKMYRK